eukprot:5453620-Prymnesium_polylepis.1
MAEVLLWLWQSQEAAGNDCRHRRRCYFPRLGYRRRRRCRRRHRRCSQRSRLRVFRPPGGRAAAHCSHPMP